MNLSGRLWERCRFGRSTTTVIPDGTSVDEAVARIAVQLEEPAVIVGLSLGGILAMALARQVPEKVAGLVLIATNAKAPSDEQQRGWQECLDRLDDGKEPAALQRDLLPVLLSGSGRADDSLVAETVAAAEDLPWATLRDQLTIQMTRIDERPHLPHIVVPVEIVAGSLDQLCPVSNHEEIQSLISGANLRVSPDSGHLVALEDPGAVSDAIERIIRRLNSTSQNNSLQEHTVTLKPVAYAPYSDPDEFIREVTDRIWIDRDIEHIYENYEPDSIVHGPGGTARGVEEVVQGTTMRIAETPDHIGLAEDVVWEARGNNAFLSSHLVLGIDHIPTVDGLRIVRSRTIANCLYREGRMVEEWVVRDSLGHSLQLGIDPATVADLVPWVGYTATFAQPEPEDAVVSGDSGDRPADQAEECRMVVDMINDVWSRRNLSAMKRYFDRDVILNTVGDRTVVRPKAYQEDLLSLVSAFPGCRFEIRDIQSNYAVRYGGLRVAVTWKLVGDYTGVARFGPLTGQPVEILGISQFQIHEGKIVRETRVFDWVGVLAQINATRGDDEYAFSNLY